MAIGRGRGKFNMCDLKKDDKPLAGPKAQTPEAAMDEYLRKIDMFRKPVAKDGSCLFRVVSEQVYHTQAKHPLVRKECINYMRRHRDHFESFIEGDFDHHLFLLRDPKEWGGQVEISALSHLYECDFVIYQTVDTPPQSVTCNGYSKKIYLCFLNGNHYDSVYPISFKENAAMVQSILYELLFDDVFPEIKRREKQNQHSLPMEDNSSSGWTEVRTKQKAKAIDDISECINVSDVANNPASWQIKRSLDPTIYRNIELEVSEESKTMQQKNDFAIAAQFQFKPGDLCLATIKESKDVSETVRVKIQDINPDKCRVLSEDYKQQYYVQLSDLQPIINGDHNDSYRNLPGYYNKLDNETEFQSQRRRGKNRRTRDDEQRKHETTGSTRLKESKRHEQKSEREIRSMRRARKEAERKKEAEKEVKVPPPILSEAKVIENVEEPIKTVPSNSNETIAKPAETAAAFWGRMRTKKPTTGKPPVTQLAASTFQITVLADVKGATNDTSVKLKASDAETSTTHLSNMPAIKQSIPVQSTDTPSSPTPMVSDTISDLPSTLSTNTPLTINIIMPDSNLQSLNTNIVTSSPTTSTSNNKTSLSSVQSSTRAPAQKKGGENTDNSLPSSSPSKLTWGNSMEKLSPVVSSASEEVSTTGASVVETSVTSVLLTSPQKDRKTPSPIIDTQKFNLSTQASMKVIEVHENILATSAKMSAELHTSANYKNISSLNASVISVDSLKEINNELKSRSPNLAVTSLIQNNNTIEAEFSLSKVPATVLTNGSVSNSESAMRKSYEDRGSHTVYNNKNETPNKNSDSAEEAKDENIAVNKITQNTIMPKHKQSANKVNDNTEKMGSLKKNKSDVKKKVSFALTTDFQDKSEHVYTQVQSMDAAPLLSQSEPGKIFLPPDHREKHMTDFPSAVVNIQDMSHHPTEQSQHFIPQTFISPGMAYYPPIANYPVTPFIPMVPAMNEHAQFPVVFSYDPDGKDLPEDIAALRYFYNLGVQFQLITIQHSFPLNQPGILPLPVQPHVVRPIVMSESNANVRSTDLFSPNNGQNSSESMIEIAHANTVMTNRIPSSHTYSIQVQPQVPHYEEYELPPRLRRTPANRGNPRLFHHRSPTGGRGIMGQAPRPRSDFIRTNNQVNYPS